MSYSPLFDPDVQLDAEIPELPFPEGDRTEKPIYVYTPDIKLAVNVALATGRPLLLRGDPGSGKSSLARHVAWRLEWRYYEEVITSRTSAQDLQWKFDALRRLQDAQVPGKDLNPVRYINPGILWWALNAGTARFRGVFRKDYPKDLSPLEDPAAPNGHARTVVLLDEIDKADPDVPNNLLDVLGSLHFKVADLNDVKDARAEVSGPAPLMFITTNGERELPEAFLRRCIVLRLKGHNEKILKIIARTHFPAGRYEHITEALIQSVYTRLETVGEVARKKNVRVPSTAEFLDTLRACDQLTLNETDPNWIAITNATLWKADVTMKTAAGKKKEEPA